MKEKLSRSANKALNRSLAIARKKEPGLTRAKFLDRQRVSQFNGQDSLSDKSPSQSKDWCAVGQKICPDVRNPYKELDACLRCPSIVKLGRLFDAETNLTD